MTISPQQFAETNRKSDCRNVRRCRFIRIRLYSSTTGLPSGRLVYEKLGRGHDTDYCTAAADLADVCKQYAIN